MNQRNARILGPCLAAVMGMLFYIASRGLSHISPYSLAWLCRQAPYADRFNNLAGWLSFQNEPWRFPLGWISSQFAPAGTNLGYTDSIPWFSVLMKLLAPSSGEPVQFFGIYQLLSYGLYAYFAYRIFEVLELESKLRFLATLLMLFSPVLLHRSFHLALTSHWVLLAAIYFYFAERLSRARPVSWMVLVAITSATHPYLAVMVLGIAVTSALVGRRVVFAALYVMTMLVSLWAFGYFAVRGGGLFGFELFSSDLLSFFNSMWLSRFFPQIRMSPSQYEGFAYLGLGILALGIRLIWRKDSKTPPIPGLFELSILATLFAFYSFSSHVSIAGHTIFTIEWFYKPLSFITGPFRSCGRFIWVAYYILMIWIIVRTVRSSPDTRKAVILLIAAIALQCLDLSQAIALRREPTGGVPKDLSFSQWGDLPTFSRVEFMPTGFPDPKSCTGGVYDGELYERFAFFIAERRMVSNSGLRAHVDIDALSAQCRTEAENYAKNGGWLSDTLYVMRPEEGHAQPTHAPPQGCDLRHGVLLCFDPSRSR
jgi:hypothetical protein